MIPRAAFGVALVALLSCGGRFAAEALEDAGSVDAEPTLDASREGQDAAAPEAAPDANAQEVQVSLCPAGEAACPDIDQCLKQIAASPPQGVVTFAGDMGEAMAVDYLHMQAVSNPELLNELSANGGELVGGDGTPYVFAGILDEDEWVVVNGDVAPQVYKLVVQYLQCRCALGHCGPQDGAVGD